MREIILNQLRNRFQLDEDELKTCIKLERESGQGLDKILQHKGLLSEIDILSVFGDTLGLDLVTKLDDEDVPGIFLQKVPVQFARQNNLIGIGESYGVIRVATCSPIEVHPIDDLAIMLDLEVEPVLAPRSEITALINRAYKHKADVVDEALADVEDSADMVGLGSVVEESEDLLDVANKAPLIKLVNMVLFQALKMRASDVHIQPYPDRLQVRYRIDGILYDMESPPKKIQEAIISRIKVMGKMDIAERRLPQDGRASIKLGDGEVDVRISSVPTSYGERIVMRLLDKTARVLTLGEIGLDARNRELIDQYIHYSHGIIFVTGPTGSGKTTTLYASLTTVNSAEKNVMTIEDPIEYQLGGVSQIEVNTKKGLTFAAGLRSLLRQDPDIMMVGEVRDKDTADIAIRAALTGHLVFSTLHTNDAASAVTRLVDIGVEPYLVSSSVVMICAQRLVRLICPKCRELAPPDNMMVQKLREVGLTPDDLPEGRMALGKGCDYCFSTGYTDRTAIYEILPIDEVVQGQVMDNASAAEIKRKALERGLRTLRMDGVKKIIEGRTTVDEVLRVTQLDVV
ncbi:MAG: ATPase, T2SS/T4P/T4SS family [Planctomycetota bacterium]